VAKNIAEELKELEAEEARIRERKAKLQESAKAEALANVNKALEELNALGYDYRLVEGKQGKASTPRTPSTGTRRSGIRDEVLDAIKATTDGISPADIRAKLGIGSDDKSGAQSVANALSALKKQNKIADKDGLYIAA